MANFDAFSNSRSEVLRIALFGPQVTHWTHDSLSGLQSALLQNTNLEFLTKTLVRLPSLWATLEKDCGLSGFCVEEKLKELKDFAAGRSIPDAQNLSNTHLAPLTVVSQVVDFVSITDGRNRLLEFQAVQGFCIGFLSAAALASSSNWTEFERHVSNSLRLATCIGIIIDAEDALHAPPDRATTVSVRWKTASDRAYLETSLDLFPDVRLRFCFWLPYPISSDVIENLRPNLSKIGLRLLHNRRSDAHDHAAKSQPSVVLFSTWRSQNSNYRCRP